MAVRSSPTRATPSPRCPVTAQRAGRGRDTESCYAFRFVDGQVADGVVFVSDPYRLDEFWA
ncbi:MAG TPA: hypothetical protein VE623_10950 [Acidimicrobiales bacterium]|nr:hypothetical protein [Acidimicrobiales bacterium]